MKATTQYFLKFSGKFFDHNTVKLGSGAGPRLIRECKTLKEFLVDYATEETKKIGEEFIKKELKKITNASLKESIINAIAEIEKGNRDFRY